MPILRKHLAVPFPPPPGQGLPMRPHGSLPAMRPLRSLRPRRPLRTLRLPKRAASAGTPAGTGRRTLCSPSTASGPGRPAPLHPIAHRPGLTGAFLCPAHSSPAHSDGPLPRLNVLPFAHSQYHDDASFRTPILRELTTASLDLNRPSPPTLNLFLVYTGGRDAHFPLP